MASASKAHSLVITVVTGNKKKLEEVSLSQAQYLHPQNHNTYHFHLLQIAALLTPPGSTSPIQLRSEKIDLPELQGEPEDIVREKCRLASERVSQPGPVLVDDTSLCYNALHGLPGPYIKWFMDKTGHEGLNKILAGYEDKSAYAQCIFAFCPSPGAPIKTFVGKTAGTIVEPRGSLDFGWDPIFQPEGYDKTYAELDTAVKNTISHRSRAAEKLRAYLSTLAAS